MGLGGRSLLSRVGLGDGVSLGGRGRGDSRWCVFGGGIAINRLPEAAACCVCGLVSGGAAGACGGGTAGGGGGGGVALAGGRGVPVGVVGVACARRAVLAVPGWLWCRDVRQRRWDGRPGGAVVRR